MLATVLLAVLPAFALTAKRAPTGAESPEAVAFVAGGIPTPE